MKEGRSNSPGRRKALASRLVVLTVLLAVVAQAVALCAGGAAASMDGPATLSPGDDALSVLEGEVIYAYDWEDGIFQDGYEGWRLGDSDPAGGAHYWDDDADQGARAHGGVRAMHCADAVNGTQIGTPQAYYDDMEAFAMRKIDLSGWAPADTLQASFYLWYETEEAEDWFEFWISAADAAPGSWQRLDALSGSSGGWVQRTFDFGPYAGQPDVWIAFQFVSDGAGHGPEGAYVDDLAITGRRALLAPALSEPAHNAALCDLTPAFRWQAVAGATSYEIELDNNAAFDSPEVSAAVPGTSFTVPAALGAGTYHWRVRGVDDRGGGPWSSARRFSAAGAEPAAPSLSKPADGALLCEGPYTLRWDTVSGASQCRIQVDDDPAFRSPEFQATGAAYCSGQAVVDDPLVPGTYHWRVSAANACGEGPWSAVRQFSVKAILEAPILLSPADGSGSGDPTPTFRWTQLDAVALYRLQVDDEAGFSSPAVDSTADTVEYTPGQKLVPGDYFWQVRGENECGAGPWSSPAWGFTVELDTEPPARIEDLSAAEGKGVGTVELRWTAPGDDGQVGTASSYEVRYNLVPISQDNWDRCAVAAGEPVPLAAGSPQVMTVSGLIPNQTYFFAIRARDEVPNLSEISNSPSARAAVHAGWRRIYLPLAGR